MQGRALNSGCLPIMVDLVTSETRRRHSLERRRRERASLISQAVNHRRSDCGLLIPLPPAARTPSPGRGRAAAKAHKPAFSLIGYTRGYSACLFDLALHGLDAHCPREGYRRRTLQPLC
jgi:hypothetical protein